MALRIHLCPPDDDRYDPDLLRLQGEGIPATKAGTEAGRSRKRARKGLFLPATALPKIQASVSRLSTARALDLWLTIRAQTKMKGKNWVRVRAQLRESPSFNNRAGHSRAVEAA